MGVLLWSQNMLPSELNFIVISHGKGDWHPPAPKKTCQPLGCLLRSLLSKFVACGGNGGTASTLAKTGQTGEGAKMLESGLERWGAFEPHSSSNLGDVASQNCIKRVGWCPLLPWGTHTVQPQALWDLFPLFCFISARYYFAEDLLYGIF